jgi:hypothetical protein
MRYSMPALGRRKRMIGGSNPGPHRPPQYLKARTRITAFARWLDEYWEDPELRTGFWRSGW